MISKFILPWFGGGTAVWTAAMLFFQVLLLGGYAYAHWISGLEPRRQGRLHLVVLLVVLAWTVFLALTRETPITPDPRWKPAGGALPVWQVLGVLSVSVGVPYLLLSTTSSLAQSWFRQVRRQSSPYAYYALSNAASLLALLTYPVLFEPNWTVRQQAAFWTVGFIVFLGLIGLCAVMLIRSGRQQLEAQPLSPVENNPPADDDLASQPPTRRAYLFWISLAACSSVMLLAVTNEITQDVASVPFLWVMPLSLYLLSFILAFNDRLVKLRRIYVILVQVALGLGYLSLEMASDMVIVQRIAANAVLLFIICLLCHSELYARRPHPRYLTSFYLMVSIGGAVGGILVSLLAPLLFPDFWEYPLGLIYAGVVAAVIAFQSRGSWLYRLRFPYALAALVLAGFIIYTQAYWFRGSVKMTRNFYGVLRVRSANVSGMDGFSLVHGGILHGSQVRQDPYRYQPTKYYTESTGVGLAIKNHPRRLDEEPMRLGVVGLGVGTIAVYGKPGDVIRFYEINPEVVDIAYDERYFTYLTDSPAEVEIVMGDARLSMERELQENQPQDYDVLAVDAFSGDSIPTHLINREALALYLAHLDREGILALHISNRHIDLEPIVALLAEEYGLETAVINGGSGDWQGSHASWILLSPSKTVLSAYGISLAKTPLQKRTGIRVWTDDYSNLFQVLEN